MCNGNCECSHGRTPNKSLLGYLKVFAPKNPSNPVADPDIQDAVRVNANQLMALVALLRADKLQLDGRTREYLRDLHGDISGYLNEVPRT